ncbi:MAG: CopG family transcriptional regulator [Cyanobium sp.]
MRTTLTLDDDLAEALNRAARLTGRSFKAVVNDTLRRGLAQSGSGTAKLEPFVVEPQSCGWMPGIDPLRLNQLLDGLEISR